MQDWSLSFVFPRVMIRLPLSISRSGAMMSVGWWGRGRGGWAAGWRRRTRRSVAAFSFCYWPAGTFFLRRRRSAPSTLNSLIESFQSRRLHDQPAAIELLTVHLFDGILGINVVLELLESWWKYDERVASPHLDAHYLPKGAKEGSELVLGRCAWVAFDENLRVPLPLRHWTSINKVNIAKVLSAPLIE